MNEFWQQLLDRKVVRAAIAYAVVAWLVLQVGDTLTDMLQLPESVDRWLVVIVAVGFPVTLILSWVFDVSLTGITITRSGQTDKPESFTYTDPKRVDVATLDLSLSQRGQLVGRIKEKGLIQTAVDQAVRGQGGVILIGGEPGIGKTRLAEEALEIGLMSGMLPLTGHAYEERGAPFITSSEILEEIIRVLPKGALRNALGPTAPEMSRLLPELRRVFPEIPESVELQPDQQQRYLFNSVLEFLSRLSQCCPLIFLLDDLHWADESSILLLEHVLPKLPSQPVLFVVTYRDLASDMGDAFQRVLPEFLRKPFVTRISLERLSFDDVRGLLSELGGSNPPEATVELFMQQTQGNAFFVHSVYRHLAEEGQLFDDSGRWITDIGDRVVPEDVRLVIEHRVNRLSGEAGEFLRIAAVMGMRFRLEVVEAAGQLNSDSMLNAVEEAESAGLIVPAADRRGARYEFSHALVRQTMRERISTARLQRLHLRIAIAMQDVLGDEGSHLVSMARHFYRAGSSADTDLTRHYLDLAGQQLLATSATDEAIVLFDTALTMEGQLKPAQRARLLYHKGLALRGQGRWLDAATVWQEALPILEESGEVEIVARVCWDLAYQSIWIGQSAAAIALGQRGLQALGDEASSGRSRLLAILGHAHETACDWESSETCFKESIELAERLGEDRLLGAEVLLSRVYQAVHWIDGNLAAETADRAIEIIRRHGSPWDLSSILGISTIAYTLSGRFDEAEALYTEGIELAERNGDIGSEMNLLMMQGCLHCFRGDFDDGRELLQESTNWCLDKQLPWASIHQTWLAMAHFWSGDWVSSAGLLEEAVESEVPDGFLYGTERAHQLLTLAYATDERARTLLRDLEPLLPTVGSQNPQGRWFIGMATLEASVLLGSNEIAASLYPCAAQLIAADATVLWTLGLSEKHAAIAAAAGGDWDRADTHFDTALRQAEDIGYPMGRAETLFWRGRMMLGRDGKDDAAARDLLQRACGEFAESGMKRHAELAADLIAS